MISVDAWSSSVAATFQLMIASAVGAMLYGSVAAWASFQLSRGGRCERALCQIVAIGWAASASMPLVIHAAVWEQTLGKFGWAAISAGRGVDPGRWFQQSAAVTWIHVAASSGLVYWLIRIGISRLPPGLHAIAALQSSAAASYWRFFLPACRGWLLIGGLLAALIAGTEMTVADLYAMVTVADRFYLYFAAQPTLVSASIAAFPAALGIAVAIVAVSRHKRFKRPTASVDTFATDQNPSSQFVVGQNLANATPSAIAVRSLAIIVALITSGVVIAIPSIAVFAKLGQTFDGWSFWESIHRIAKAPLLYRREWFWSLAVGGGAAILATTVASGLVALMCRHKVRQKSRVFQMIVEIVLWTMFCLPGPLVGLAVVSLFRLPFPAADFIATKTLVPLWIATLFRTLPIAYLILKFSVDNLPITSRRSAQLHLSPTKRIAQFIAPMMFVPVLATLALTAIIAAGDVPVTLPVAPPGVTTMATRLFGLLHSGARYPEAVLTLMYVGSIVTVIVVATVLAASRRLIFTNGGLHRVEPVKLE